MNILDATIIFIIAFSTSCGFFFGLIRVLGAIANIIISIIIAGLFFKEIAQILKPYLLDNLDLSMVIGFIAIYWISSLFLSFIIKIVNKIFNLPILKTVNRLLGASISLLGSVIILSIFFYLIDKYAWVEELKLFIGKSSMASTLIEIGKYVSIAIPGL